MDWSQGHRQAVLDQIHGLAQTAYAPDYYLAAFEGDPFGAGTEVSGGDYARQQVAWNAADQDGVATNDGEIVFPGGWTGTVDYLAAYDAATNGNLLGRFVVAEAKEIGEGDVLKVADGALSDALPASITVA